MNECAAVLASLLMYGRHPATLNSPGWVVFTVPADFLEIAEQALAKELEKEWNISICVTA